MNADQDQWTAIVIVALVLACGVGCCVRHVVDRGQSEAYVLEEDPET